MKYFTTNTILGLKKGEYGRESHSVLLLGNGVGTGDQESAKGSDSNNNTLYLERVARNSCGN